MAQHNQLELRTRQVGPWSMNTYAVVCPNTGQSVLIDPGDDPDRLTEMLSGSTPVAILLTHTHPDHIGALDEMRRRLDVPVAAYPGIHGGVQNPGLLLDAEIELRDGDRFIVGDHRLRVYHAPGHIVDQICFYLEDDTRVIVGDTIFDGGPGKTWSADQFRETLATLRDVVLSWPDDTVCYPGHGRDFSI
jgi:glyoxylase-like metal-dependent hydrolase (beta-lactamase superfamily II)